MLVISALLIILKKAGADTPIRSDARDVMAVSHYEAKT